MSQVEDNCSYMAEFVPMTQIELALTQEVAEIYRKSGPMGGYDLSKYENVSQKNLPLAGLMDCRNAMALRPNPYFGAEGK